MSGPQVLSMRQAALELGRRHGLPVTHNDVSFLVRVLSVPTHSIPTNARARGLDRSGFRRLDRFLGRERKIGA